MRPIESAAAVDSIWNRPQLAGGRIIGARLDQVTIDHELSYDALAADESDLRRLVCWPAHHKRDRGRWSLDRDGVPMPRPPMSCGRFQIGSATLSIERVNAHAEMT